MAQPSTDLMTEYGYFHAGSKTLTKEGQYTFESPYAAGHVSLMKDILAEEIPYFANQTELDTFITNNPGVITKYENVPLSEIVSPTTGYPTTDGQSWYLDVEGEWLKPILNGALAPHETTNSPSSILDPVLYRDNGTIVPSTMGTWWIDPFQGLVRFGYGYEPNKSAPYGGTAIGTPHITCYVYTGKKLLDVLSDQVENREHVYTSTEPALVHNIEHNLDSMALNTTILESNGSGGWREIMVNTEHLDENNSRIELTESINIKATFRKIG